jgi:hypothetical protein
MTPEMSALIMTSPTSRSLDFEKSWPQNCTKEGKHMEPSTPLRSMSLTRSLMS